MFGYRLQKLMDLRQRARDQRRAELAHAYAAEQILRQQQATALDQLQRLKAERRQAAQPGDVSVDHLLSGHRYELLVRSQLKVLAQRSGQVAQEIERRRQALVEAEKDFRVLEKLRDKLQHRHRRETERREQRQLDEIALWGTQKGERV